MTGRSFDPSFKVYKRWDLGPCKRGGRVEAKLTRYKGDMTLDLRFVSEWGVATKHAVSLTADQVGRLRAMVKEAEEGMYGLPPEDMPEPNF